MVLNTNGLGPTGRWQRSTWTWLVALLVVCAALRVFMALTTEPLLSPDSHGYLLLAREIADLDLSPDSGLRTPMYPLFAMVFGRDPMVVRAAQMGLGLLLTALLFWLGRRMTGSDLIATLTGAGYGLSFSQLFFENSILTETLTTFGVTVSVLALLRVFDRLEQGDSPAGWIGLMGLTSAVTALARPSFVFLPALLAAALVPKIYRAPTTPSARRKASHATGYLTSTTEAQRPPSQPDMRFAWVRQSIGLLIPALLPALILIGGWSAFNYTRFGYFSPSTISGYTLTDHSVGFIEYAPDRYATIRDTYLDLRRAFGVQYVSVWHGVEPLKEALGLTTDQLSRVLMQMSLDLFARQPLRYAHSVWLSWVQFWNAYGGYRGVVAWEGARDPTIALALGYLFRAAKYIYLVFNAIFLTWAAAVGFALIFFRRQRRSWITSPMLVMAAVILTTSLLSSLMQGGGLTAGGSNRYAMPVQPLLVCVALAALWRLWQARPAERIATPTRVQPADDTQTPLQHPASPAPQRRASPWILVFALAAKLALLTWMAYYGFPREWGDMTFFKQPAYMALHTGSFTLPTAMGHRPFADIVYAAYPPLYTYASWLGFKLFGFSVYASLGLDLIIHLTLTGLLGWLLWRKTGRQVVAALFVLLSIAFFLPEGRPDELAALLVLLAIIACARRRPLVCGLLLGASLATQPTQAILGIIVCACVDLMGSRLSIRFVARWIGIGAAMLVTCGLIWLPSVATHLPEAWAQFRAHSTQRWEVEILQLLSRERLWAPFWIALLAVLAGGGLLAVVRPPAMLRPDTEEGRWLRGLLLALPICLVFLWLIKSPFYGYRLLNVLYLAIALYLAHAFGDITNVSGARSLSDVLSLPKGLSKRHPSTSSGGVPSEQVYAADALSRSRSRRRQAAAMLAVGVLCLTLVVFNYNILRFVLAPLTWGKNTVTYAQAAAAVRATVPPDATVGGDTIAWWMIADGRPFYAFPWYQAEPWPDYILSTALWGPPNVLQRKEQAERLAAEYVEVTPFQFPVETCALRVFGRAVPLSQAGAGCDWYIWIWKRK